MLNVEPPTRKKIKKETHYVSIIKFPESHIQVNLIFFRTQENSFSFQFLVMKFSSTINCHQIVSLPVVFQKMGNKLISTFTFTNIFSQYKKYFQFVSRSLFLFLMVVELSFELCFIKYIYPEGIKLPWEYVLVILGGTSL